MMKRYKFPLTKVLLLAMLVGLGSFTAQGQTPNLLQGTKTGNFIPIGILGFGSDAGISPVVNYHSTYILGGFYYAPSTALNSDLGPFTTLTAARSLSAVGIPVAGADVYIQFRATSGTIAANTPTYFRLGNKPVLSGLGLPLGGLLGLIELQNIKGAAYSGAGNYSIGIPSNANAGTLVGNSVTKLLIDKSANWFASVTPDATYNSVRLNVQFPTDLSVLDVGRTLKVNVYNAFTLTGNSCSTLPQFTNAGEATGITLNVGAVASGLELSQLVENPQYAINGVSTQYSSFSSGLASVGVATTVSQSFFYDHASTANDGVHIKLGMSNSLIGLSLLQLNGIKFYAYLGTSETPVYTKGLGDLATLLSLDVLSLINIGSSHKEIELSFKPGFAFDRFKIEFDKGLLGVGVVGDALRIYDVSLQPSAPTITVQPTVAAATVCEGSAASFSVTATVPAGGTITNYQWQYFDGSDWTNTGTNATTLTIATTTLAMNSRKYRVKVIGGSASCPQETISIPVPLTVNAKPGITLSASAAACRGVTNALLGYSATTGSPLTYSITWVTTGLSNVVDAALSTSPINITIPANAAVGTYQGNLTVKNVSGCVSSSMPFSTIVHPKPMTPFVAVQ